MLRFLYTISLLVLTGICYGQFSEQSISLNGATEVRISAQLSSIEIMRTSGTEVLVQHEFYINGQAQPEDCELSQKHSGTRLEIRETGPSTADLNNSWSNSGFSLNQDDNDEGGRNRRDHQEVKAHLFIKVPAGVAVVIDTEYGSVKATDISGLREVKSTYGSIDLIYNNQYPPAQGLKLDSEYGAIDLSLPEGLNANIELETNYGSLLTDFDITIDANRSREEDFHQEVIGQIGRGGDRVSCRSPYSNIYLRKSK